MNLYMRCKYSEGKKCGGLLFLFLFLFFFKFPKNESRFDLPHEQTTIRSV